ncbi:hypothetical protein OEZ85_014347 [Tetradesmus obliquus]|uniref:Uncharacterized protein n=1 Tax=Tetradesmus obliquus TaxID=3088 RepID=A0ABY8UA51_TETOB|nr:hypothetical protein OEZ85_014347 [Tetradesmus obliquus]
MPMSEFNSRSGHTGWPIVQELVCKHSLIKGLAAAIKTGLRLLQAESTQGSTAADEQSQHSREDPSDPREAGLRVLLSLQETFTELLLTWANPTAEPGSTAANRSEMAKQLAKSGLLPAIQDAAKLLAGQLQPQSQHASYVQQRRQLGS